MIFEKKFAHRVFRGLNISFVHTKRIFIVLGDVIHTEIFNCKGINQLFALGWTVHYTYDFDRPHWVFTPIHPKPI